MRGTATWFTYIEAHSASVVAVATIVAVVVAAVYTVFTIFMWRATRAQADITGLMFEAGQRPYVSVVPQWGGATNVDIDEFGFECVFENYGVRPAMITTWELHASLGQRQVGSDSVPESEGLWLFPGHPYTRPLKFTGDGAWPTREVRIEATLRYRGATGRVFRTRMTARVSGGRWEQPRYEIE